MKKLWIILLFFLLSSVFFPKDIVRLGAYAGYFSPKDTALSNIYNKEKPIFGAKLGVRVWNEFFVWLSAMHYQKNGETTLLGDETKLTLNPISLTLRYTIPLGSFNPYLGAGITYLYYKEDSSIGDVKGEKRGYTVDAGFEILISQRFALDIGASYSDVKVHPTGFDVNLGGFQAGLTLVLRI